MITRAEILQGRDKEYPLTPELEDNLKNLLEAVNKLRKLYGKLMRVSSGYRPGRFNVLAGGAKNSTHLYCMAVDFADKDGKLKEFITLEILEKCGLWAESFHATPSWLHVDIRPRKNRIFTP